MAIKKIPWKDGSGVVLVSDVDKECPVCGAQGAIEYPRWEDDFFHCKVCGEFLERRMVFERSIMLEDLVVARSKAKKLVARSKAKKLVARSKAKKQRKGQ